MPKLILKLDNRTIAEYVVGAQPITIGRSPANHIVIDNPTVSGRHARVYREGPHSVLEDLKSTNGTFVNDKPIARHTLLEADAVLIGKHTLVFTQLGIDHGENVRSVPAIVSNTPRPKPLLSGPDQGRPSQIYDAVVPATAVQTPRRSFGTIKVIAGDTGQDEYLLAADTTTIGKADTAQIRLKGWFKPDVAATIARHGAAFAITPMRGRLSVNGERVTSRRDLASGDRIEVSGVTLEFTLS
jgi:predicted component of type VI protein secretion system